MNQQVQIGALAAAELANLDWVLCIDHSGSMGSPSTRLQGRTRIQEVQEDAIAIARLAEQHDQDGLTAIGFSSGVNTKDGVKSDAIENIFKEFAPRGSTNLTAALQAAIGKAEQSNKETVVLVFTDGAPDDEKSVIQTIKSAATKFGRPKLGFAFIQVGDDPGATNFLDHLDNGLGEGVPDCVATVRAQEAEKLSVEQLAWLARNK